MRVEDGCLEEWQDLWDGDVEQGGREDDGGRLEIEVVDLGAQARRQVSIFDFLQARTVDVPNAALPDVS